MTHFLRSLTYLMLFATLLVGCKADPFPGQRVSVGADTMQPMSVAAGDFTGNGTIDLAVAMIPTGGRTTGGHIVVLLNDGQGGLEITTTHRTGDGPNFVTAADLDDDGALDLLVINGYDGHLSILMGRGDGTFEDPAHYPYPRGAPDMLTTADANDDGILDVVLATTNPSAPPMALLGVGDGTFEPENPIPLIPSQHGPDEIHNAALDATGDGLLDLAVVTPRSGKVYLFPANGQPATEMIVGKASRGILDVFAGGDFNGDGRTDLVVGTHKTAYDQDVRLLLSTGDVSYTLTEPLPGIESPREILAADFTGNGYLDLLASPRAGPDVEVYHLTLLPGQGGGRFGGPVRVSLAGFPYEMTLGDVDGDGAVDFVVRNLEDASVTLRFNRW